MENTFNQDYINLKDMTDEILENSNRDANQIKAYLNNNDFDRLIEYMIKQHEKFINLNKNILSKIYKLKFIYLMVNFQNQQANNLYLEDIQIFNRESFSIQENERKNFFYRNSLNGKIQINEYLLALEKSILEKNIATKFILFYTEKIKKYKDLTLNLGFINQYVNDCNINNKDEMNISNLMNSEDICNNNYEQDFYINMIRENVKVVDCISYNKQNFILDTYDYKNDVSNLELRKGSFQNFSENLKSRTNFSKDINSNYIDFKNHKLFDFKKIDHEKKENNGINYNYNDNTNFMKMNNLNDKFKYQNIVDYNLNNKDNINNSSKSANKYAYSTTYSTNSNDNFNISNIRNRDNNANKTNNLKQFDNISFTSMSQNKHLNSIFKFNFDKKENIDKKILRKFRSFLSDEYKSGHCNHKDIGKYLLVLIKNNSLPPFKFDDEGNNVEFKSFNTNFLNWMFSKKEVVKYFDLFLQNELSHIMIYFCDSYPILNNGNKNNEQYKLLNRYISQYSTIYSNFLSSKHYCESETITTSNVIMKHNEDYNNNEDKNNFFNYISTKEDNNDNLKFIEKINNKSIFNHSFYIEENLFDPLNQKSQEKPFVSLFEEDINQKNCQNCDKHHNDENTINKELIINDEIINNNPANNDYNITYIDDVSYQRLTNDFVTCVRNVDCENSFDAGYLLNRSLERSRDYDVWVYPDELYPFLNNNEEISNPMFKENFDENDVRMDNNLKDDADNE